MQPVPKFDDGFRLEDILKLELEHDGMVVLTLHGQRYHVHSTELEYYEPEWSHRDRILLDWDNRPHTLSLGIRPLPPPPPPAPKKTRARAYGLRRPS